MKHKINCHKFIICTHILIDTCYYGEIRLVGGENEMEGRVKMCINNRWGTVCNSEWSPAHTKVVCRSLGFGYNEGKLILILDYKNES